MKRETLIRFQFRPFEIQKLSTFDELPFLQKGGANFFDTAKNLPPNYPRHGIPPVCSPPTNRTRWKKSLPAKPKAALPCITRGRFSRAQVFSFLPLTLGLRLSKINFTSLSFLLLLLLLLRPPNGLCLRRSRFSQTLSTRTIDFARSALHIFALVTWPVSSNKRKFCLYDRCAISSDF